jgi:hypothetical protein
MKAFSVNKNSWHYKLNIQMVQTNDMLKLSNNAETYVQSKDNLCSYWQMTIWSMFKVVVMLSVIGAGIFGIGFILYSVGSVFFFYPKESLTATVVIAAVIGFIIGMAALGAWFDNRRRMKLDKILRDGETETSLAKAKYSSWKHGVCLPVEFKE